MRCGFVIWTCAISCCAQPAEIVRWADHWAGVYQVERELVHAVIEDRRYLDRLAEDVPPVDLGLPPRARLEAVLRWLWRATLEEEALVRLILGESLRAEPAALEIVRQLLAAMDAGFEAWLTDLLPELPGDKAAMARILRSQLIAWLIEGVLVAPPDREASFDRHAAELAAVLAPA